MTKKKKILYIITQGSWGGAQRYIYDLSNNLGMNYKIYVATGKKNNNDLQNKLAKNPNITFIELKHLIRPINPIHDLMAIREIRKLLKKIKPDVVHLNSTKAGLIGSLANINKKCKVIYTVHGWVFNEKLSIIKKWLYTFIEKYTAKLKNKIVVLSKNDLEDGLKIKINKNKLKIIPLGIKSVENKLNKQQARQKLSEIIKKDFTDNDLIFLTIANFYKTKGLEFLIRSAKEIVKTNPKANFVIIGDGKQKKELTDLIQKSNLQNNIWLTGQIKNAGTLLPSADLFLLTSLKEGLPYVVLEAINYEIPIIATDVGGISTVITNKKSGILIPPENVDKITEVVTDYINNPATFNSYADNAKNNIANFSLDKMLTETKTLYEII